MATSERDLLRSTKPPKSLTMTTLLKPSSILPQGLRLQQINNLTLFKFTDELSHRLQTLLDKKKADTLTATETIELATIGELDDIFSYINATIAAHRPIEAL
jgi:hypothetical protein